MSIDRPWGVVFDVGGVLVRISNTWQKAAETAGIPVGLRPDEPVYLEDLEGFRDYQVGLTEEPQYLESIARALGVRPEEALRVHQGILVEAYPGALELVGELKAAGIATGVLSNTNRPHWDLLTDPNRYPEVAGIPLKVASHLVGMQKPDPRIFLHTSKAFGFAPERIVYFDDSPANIAAALSLGWRAYQTDPFSDPVALMRSVLNLHGLITG